MTRNLSLLITWACTALLIVVPLIALYYLASLETFARHMMMSIHMPIRWDTVTTGQWYGLWGLMLTYVSIGLYGLFHLRRAFSRFASGSLFDLSNSRDLKTFSIFLLLQTLVLPLHYAATSVLLSLNHPAGQKMLSLSFGSNELRAIGVALVLWVLSNLLVEACKLDSENRQFI